MTPEQFERVGELYHATLELAPEARRDFLLRACAGEDELRREVESLLQAREEADGFIAGRVAGVVAEMAEQQQSPLSAPSLAPSPPPSLAPSLVGHDIGNYQVLSLLA